ncbi:MAG: patatin-like phospholipase family protein [Spirochaetaceae bacterium]|nr:patatin-like phospholipase family protein [Spirochaetaceae bacterium]
MGVWKAMEEYGLTDNVKIASGTSVGALNAALFANVSTTKAEQLWREKIGFLAVLTPDIGKISLSADKIASFVKELQGFYQYAKQRNLIAQQNAAEIPETSDIHPEEQEKGGNAVLATVVEGAKIGGSALVDYAKDFFLTDTKTPGVFSRESLASIIKQNITSPSSYYNSWDFDVYATTVRKDGLLANAVFTGVGALFDLDIPVTNTFHLNEQRNTDHITQILLASSAIPIAFDSVTLPKNVILNGAEVGQEFEYIDGGFELVGGRNTPVTPLLTRTDIDTVFVVYLKSIQELGGKRTDTSSLTKKGMSVVEIIPSQPLGNIIKGTLNFSEQQIQELIDLGYQDTLRVLSSKGYRKPSSYNSWSYSYDDYYNSGSSSYYDDGYYSDDSYYYDNDSYYDEDDYYYNDGYDSYDNDYYYDGYSYWYD